MLVGGLGGDGGGWCGGMNGWESAQEVRQSEGQRGSRARDDEHYEKGSARKKVHAVRARERQDPDRVPPRKRDQHGSLKHAEENATTEARPAGPRPLGILASEMVRCRLDEQVIEAECEADERADGPKGDGVEQHAAPAHSLMKTRAVPRKHLRYDCRRHSPAGFQIHRRFIIQRGHMHTRRGN